jgi:hypothetical protein
MMASCTSPDLVGPNSDYLVIHFWHDASGNLSVQYDKVIYLASLLFDMVSVWTYLPIRFVHTERPPQSACWLFLLCTQFDLSTVWHLGDNCVIGILLHQQPAKLARKAFSKCISFNSCHETNIAKRQYFAVEPNMTLR